MSWLSYCVQYEVSGDSNYRCCSWEGQQMTLNVLLFEARVHQKGDQTKSCRRLQDTREMLLPAPLSLSCFRFHWKVFSPCAKSQRKTRWLVPSLDPWPRQRPEQIHQLCAVKSLINYHNFLLLNCTNVYAISLKQNGLKNSRLCYTHRNKAFSNMEGLSKGKNITCWVTWGQEHLWFFSMCNSSKHRQVQ